MNQPTAFLDRADATACQQFQSTLQQSAVRPIEEYLPREDHADYVGTLCRLIKLELEHRWREFHRRCNDPAAATTDYPAGVKQYLERFPVLKQHPDAVRFLLQEEFRLQHQFGGRPDASEYRERHAEWLMDVPTLAVPEQAPSLAEESPRTIPGFRILEELGRGGMGVVYKAEQISLRRIAALKMILAERHAGPEELSRFRTEAESIAQLHHPNIVQVYEVGQHDGCPYFSMEFIEGGSLARALNGKPLPPMSAAHLAEMLARAMHHAHQRGVIHRDLKPANVLLQESAGQQGELGFPKISDFGLAKRLDDDMGQTRSGAIMGTPCYMAPEQAAGRVHEIGPLTDVYALGAILYETLTGRPPFRAATSAETMHEVINKDVVPPSRWRPALPRDLETICLKALAKEPIKRYSSALELADDLARAGAGEPILARRESLAARLWRKVRRRPAAAAMTAAAAVALMAGLIVGYFVVKDTHSSRAAALEREAESALQERDWPDGHLAFLDAKLAELDEFAPDRANELKQRLPARFAEVLRYSFGPQTRPILLPQDVPAIEGRITALGQRDAELAEAVRQEFQARLRKLQSFVLKAPFANLDTVFNPKEVDVREETMQVRPGLETLATRAPCLGKVEIEAVFSEGWTKSGRLGLLLNFQPNQEYLFLFGVTDRVEPNGGDPQPPLPGDTIAGSGQLSMMIFRNGERLREVRLDAETVFASPQLTLFASREGERLTFQVNALPQLHYFDAFPPANATPGVFALRVPAGTQFQRLRLASQVLPSRPSPLERGDELYARGKFGEALEEYGRQQLPPLATESGQELRYKIAQCLFRQQRLDEALLRFEELAPAAGQRWPPLAAVHLWIIYLQRHQLLQIDTILLDLSRRYTQEHLASLIPPEIRPHLLRAYTVQSLGLHFVRHDPLRAAKLERVVALTDLVRARDYDRLHLRLSLVRAYHLAGQYPHAIQLAEVMLQDPTLAGAFPEKPHRLLHWQIRTVEEYGWLMRLSGDPHKALAAVDKCLFQTPGVYRLPYLPLLVERARLHAFLKDDKKAEADLDAFFASAPVVDLDYRYYGEAHLVLGFLRHDRGDAAATRQAWERGTYLKWFARWRAAHPQEEVSQDAQLAGSKLITNMILASLSGTMTPEAVDEIQKQALQVMLDDASALGFKGVLNITPGLFHDIWQSPRGLEAARKLALRTASWSAFHRLPASVIGVGLVREGSLPAKPSPDQEALIWKLAEDMSDAFFESGKLSKNQLFLLTTAWKGVTGVFGWGGVQRSLPVHLRGPMAYILGQRYIHKLKYVKEGRELLEAALDEAARQPANPLLERLTRAELDRMKAPE